MSGKEKLLKVKLNDLKKHRDRLKQSFEIIPVASNYIISIPDNNHRLIYEIMDSPHKSSTKLIDHLNIRYTTDECYLWFSKEQFATLMSA